MEMEPRGVPVDEHFDRFANCVHSFDLLEQHTELVVTARSEVWTPERYEDDARRCRRSTASTCCARRATCRMNGAIAELAARVRAAAAMPTRRRPRCSRPCATR